MPDARRDSSSGLLLFRVAGIDVVAHPTWVISLALLTSFARVSIVPHLRPFDRGVAPWLLALSFGLLITACILAHELCHCAVARAYGIPVRRVTMFVFGGVSQLGEPAPTPRAEFAIAMAGPLGSTIAAGVCAAVARALHPATAGLAGAWGSFALVNGVLALFNLVPAFPLDGGRLLRSALWRLTGGRARATRWASAISRALAVGLVATGAAVFLADRQQGDPLGSAWIALVGLFLYRAAGAAGRHEGGDEP